MPKGSDERRVILAGLNKTARSLIEKTAGSGQAIIKSIKWDEGKRIGYLEVRLIEPPPKGAKETSLKELQEGYKRLAQKVSKIAQALKDLPIKWKEPVSDKETAGGTDYRGQDFRLFGPNKKPVLSADEEEIKIMLRPPFGAFLDVQIKWNLGTVPWTNHHPSWDKEIVPMITGVLKGVGFSVRK
jgi:hypothetical protein